eukprot:14798074-Ditylum_brightwellii.AAC.1
MREHANRNALEGCPDSSDVVKVGSFMSEEDGVTLSEEDQMEVEQMVTKMLQKELGKIDGSDASRPEPMRFPPTMSSFIAGSAFVEKDEFTSLLDLGVPVDKGKGSGNADVLILYNREGSLPSSHASVVASDGGQTTPSIPAKDAIENCDSLNVVLTSNPGNTAQCM